MSLRVDTSSLIAGALVVGDRGLGVLGSEVPSTGENGPGYLYNDLSLPADANKEVCGRITTWPTNGDLFAYEDSSFTYDGTTDSFWYQLYVDGVATGSPVQVFLNVGETEFAFSATTGNATFSGSANSTASFSFSASTAAATFSGSAGASQFTQAELDEILAYVEANMAVPTADEIAAKVIEYLMAAVPPIPVNVEQMNNAQVIGTGVVNDKWRGA